MCVCVYQFISHQLPIVLSIAISDFTAAYWKFWLDSLYSSFSSFEVCILVAFILYMWCDHHEKIWELHVWAVWWFLIVFRAHTGLYRKNFKNAILAILSYICVYTTRIIRCNYFSYKICVYACVGTYTARKQHFADNILILSLHTL